MDAGHLRAQGTCSSPLHAPSLGCFVTPLFRAVAKLYCAVVHSLRLYTPSCHVQCHDQPRMRPRPAGVELDGPAVRGHRLLVAARPRERAAQPSVRPRPAGVNIGPLPVARTGRLSVPVARRRRAPAWPVLDGKAHCPDAASAIVTTNSGRVDRFCQLCQLAGLPWYGGAPALRVDTVDRFCQLCQLAGFPSASRS